jgi:hypothetical protein
MKRTMSRVILVLVVYGLVAGASAHAWQVTPSVQKASDKAVDVSVKPLLEERYLISVGYTGMLLEVHNKTNQTVTINWDETLYLQGGGANGGFSRKGTEGAKLGGFDVIFPGETFVTTVYPAQLADVGGIGTLTDPKLDPHHKPMPAGENGIDLKLRAGFEGIGHRLTFTISE